MTQTGRLELVDEGLARVDEAAKFLGVSKSKLYSLMDAGTLAYAKLSDSVGADGQRRGGRRIPWRAVKALAASLVVERDPGEPAAVAK